MLKIILGSQEEVEVEQGVVMGMVCILLVKVEFI